MNNLSILQLNIWAARSEKFLDEFSAIMDQRPSIVCLQECLDEYTPFRKTSLDSRNDCERLFRERYWNDYEIYFSPRQTTWAEGGNYSDDAKIGHWGNMMMWDRNIFTMLEARTVFIHGGHDTYDHKDDRTLPVNVQLLVLINKKSKKSLLVCNIHGWYGGRGYGKGDSEQRIAQSHAIVKIVRSYGDMPVVLAGDLNIRIDTESLRILEEGIGHGGNAIKNFAIPTCRTVLYEESKRNKEPHASYIITSPHIIQNNCHVGVDSLVSDHAPIWLDFSI